MIPKVFHRVWVGGHMPSDLSRLGESWLAQNPGWELRTWTDENLPPLRNQRIYDDAHRLVESRLLGRMRSNIARLEILEQFGGVYVDCDFEALAPIPSRYLSAGCFVGRETPEFVNNGIIGAVAGHPYISRLIDAIPDSVATQPGKPSNVTTGPHLLTAHLSDDVTVVPSSEVYPYPWQDAYRERQVSTDGAWAHHLWAGSRWQVSVIVPFRGGCPWRERSAEYVVGRLRSEHPDWQVTVVDSSGDKFSRSEAILRGLQKSFGRIIVVHDSDSWDKGLDAAVLRVRRKALWSSAHTKVHRLTSAQSKRFMRGLEVDINDCIEKPYRGTLAGGVTVFRRETLEACPPDPRFRGWGGEDQAHGIALKALYGGPVREQFPLVHLWHPEPERISRSVGNLENDALMRRYVNASRDRQAIRVLIEEAKTEWARMCA
jgi:inositol phosphorylceramide mannosyltransferase catalytic subunit